MGKQAVLLHFSHVTLLQHVRFLLGPKKKKRKRESVSAWYSGQISLVFHHFAVNVMMYCFFCVFPKLRKAEEEEEEEVAEVRRCVCSIPPERHTI